jgi:hypothetical protein
MENEALKNVCSILLTGCLGAFIILAVLVVQMNLIDRKAFPVQKKRRSK